MSVFLGRFVPAAIEEQRRGLPPPEERTGITHCLGAPGVRGKYVLFPSGPGRNTMPPDYRQAYERNRKQAAPLLIERAREVALVHGTGSALNTVARREGFRLHTSRYINEAGEELFEVELVFKRGVRLRGSCVQVHRNSEPVYRVTTWKPGVWQRIFFSEFAIPASMLPS